MEDLETVVFRDENGDEIEFQVLDYIEVDGQEYVIVAMPDDDDEAFILRVETGEDGTETYVTIEDDDEWDTVAEAYEELLEQEDEWDDLDDDDDLLDLDDDDDDDDDFDDVDDEDGSFSEDGRRRE
ncbi:MAG TPA: DUF1292 domain-containing protein [Sphingobacteriaceae bacterium]|nr:DUF1292 domain-containing protein [Sphingobacteriaceae bacterium]